MMTLKSTMILGLKVLGLTLLYAILFMLISGLLSAGAEPPPADQMGLILLGTILIALVNVGLITIIVRASRWSGWKLSGAVIWALYGTASFLSAIEAAYYAPALGSSYQEILALLPIILLPNLILFAIFVPLAVRVLGQWRAADAGPDRRPMIAWPQWLGKLAATAVIYYLLYFLFGFFVAWQNPELQALYSSGADNAWLMVWGVIPLQLFRGVLWVLFTLPIIRSLKTPAWQTAVIIGLLCALPMSVPLIMPNELMPDAGVRLTHFYEITFSNFLLGLVITWLFHRAHHSLRDLFGLDQPVESGRSHNIHVSTK